MLGGIDVSSNPLLRPRRLLLAGGSRLAPASAAFCRELGSRLAREPQLCLITGGLKRRPEGGDTEPGDWCFIDGARRCLSVQDELDFIETVLPELDRQGNERFQAGTTRILRNKTSQARRFAMLNSADAAVTIQGERATQQMIELAMAIEKPMLPLPFAGGKSLEGWRNNRREIMDWFQICPEMAARWESTRFQSPSDPAIPELAESVCSQLLTRLKRRCLVMMSFKTDLKPLYIDTIRPAIEEAGLIPVRADELCRAGNALAALRNAIRYSERAVAVTSDANPNVMYEVGLCHAIGKPVIIAHEKNEHDQFHEVPFDLKTEFLLGYRRDELATFKAALTLMLLDQTLRDARQPGR